MAVHGLGSNLRVWRPLHERVGQHHELIGVDLPGFGESRPPVRERGVRPLVDALEAWLDDQGLQQPHLTGFSMGGRIVLELAGRGRATTVTAVCPAGFNSSHERPFIQANLMTQRAVTRRVAPVVDKLATTAPGRTALLAVAVARPWQLTPDQAANMVCDFARSPGFRAAVHDATWGVPEGLERITCPVTVLWGTRDLILPVTGAARVHERLPAARVERLAGLGHVPMLDDPAMVASALLEATGGST